MHIPPTPNILQQPLLIPPLLLALFCGGCGGEVDVFLGETGEVTHHFCSLDGDAGCSHFEELEGGLELKKGGGVE